MRGCHSKESDDKGKRAHDVPEHGDAVENRKEFIAKRIHKARNHKQAAVDAQQLALGGHKRTIGCSSREGGLDRVWCARKSWVWAGTGLG